MPVPELPDWQVVFASDVGAALVPALRSATRVCPYGHWYPCFEPDGNANTVPLLLKTNGANLALYSNP